MSEKTSAELAEALFHKWIGIAAARGEFDAAMDELLDAHEREVIVKERAWVPTEISLPSVQFGGPIHEPDPAKADTCANCGALDWSPPVQWRVPDAGPSILRVCGHCNGTKWIHPAYPGKGAEEAKP